MRGAVQTASRSNRNLEWFEVKEIRGHIKNGGIAHFQVVMKLAPRYEK